MIKYWFKILRSTEDSPTQLVYKILKEDTADNTPNWASDIKTILQTNGFGYVWEQQGPDESEQIFISKLRQRLRDQYLQNWSDSVSQTSDHRFFKLIKKSFSVEKYLGEIDATHLRKALTKIRLGSHNFLVERGKWSKPKLKYNQRVCPTCKCIEDVYHCLVECPRFKSERKSLSTEMTKKPSMFKFTSLFQSTDVSALNKLALACYKILRKYEELK